jgi:hypothetical protein
MDDYKQQETNNAAQFMELLRAAMPSQYVIANALQQTNVRAETLLPVIYELENVGLNKFGTVLIEIFDGNIKSVKGTRNHKLDEPIMEQNNDTGDY